MIDPELTDLGVRLLPPSELSDVLDLAPDQRDQLHAVIDAPAAAEIRHDVDDEHLHPSMPDATDDHRARDGRDRELGRDQVRPLGDLLLEAAQRIETERAYNER